MLPALSGENIACPPPGKASAELLNEPGKGKAAKGFAVPLAGERLLEDVDDEEEEALAEGFAAADAADDDDGPAGPGHPDQSEGGDRNEGRAGLYSEIVGAGVIGIAAAAAAAD